MTKQRLDGSHRAEALATLNEMCANGSSSVDLDIRVARLVGVDPSLLLEPRDPKVLRWMPTFLAAACTFDWASTLKAAFEAGIHPDLKKPFGGMAVLGMRLKPSRYGLGPFSPPSLPVLQAALSHGADARAWYRSGPGEFESAMAVHYHAIQLSTTHKLDVAKEHLMAIKLLLEHGSFNLDADMPRMAQQVCIKAKGFVYFLCRGDWAKQDIIGTEAGDLLRQVVTMACRRGAALDEIGCPDPCGRAIHVLAAREHVNVIEMLLELGSPLDERLEAVLELRGGPAVVTRMREAAMRGALARLAAPANLPAAPVRRRARV